MVTVGTENQGFGKILITKWKQWYAIIVHIYNVNSERWPNMVTVITEMYT